MASFTGAFLIAYLLAASFTEEVRLNLTSVDKLVDYQYNLNFAELLPQERYNGSIIALWAVPDSALRGLEGKSVSVKVRASVGNGSPISFPSPLGMDQKSYETALRCVVVNTSCSQGSILRAEIPVIASARLGQNDSGSITLVSEIDESALGPLGEPAGLIEAVGNMLGNSSLMPNASRIMEGNGNLLDSLKPEGDAKDPMSFLRENPLVSLLALVIVILITGAYLINVKD